jgi:hypothetical protein
LQTSPGTSSRGWASMGQQTFGAGFAVFVALAFALMALFG